MYIEESHKNKKILKSGIPPVMINYLFFYEVKTVPSLISIACAI